MIFWSKNVIKDLLLVCTYSTQTHEAIFFTIPTIIKMAQLFVDVRYTHTYIAIIILYQEGRKHTIKVLCGTFNNVIKRDAMFSHCTSYDVFVDHTRNMD